MGNIATVAIRTDGLGEIRRNPEEFVENLSLAINRAGAGHTGIDFAAGSHANPAQVVELHHDNYYMLVAMGRGHGVKLAPIYHGAWKTDRELALMAVQSLIEQYGFDESEAFGPRCG